MNKRAMMVMLAFALTTQPAWAARMAVHDAAESSQYGRKAGGMLGRGVLNVVTCFVDLLVNIVNETRTGPPLVGTLVGVGKGTGCTVLRAGSGVVDVATFWVPGFNGMPVSDSYDNCLATTGSAGADAHDEMHDMPGSEWDQPAAGGAASTPAAPHKKDEKPHYSK